MPDTYFRTIVVTPAVVVFKLFKAWCPEFNVPMAFMIYKNADVFMQKVPPDIIIIGLRDWFICLNSYILAATPSALATWWKKFTFLHKSALNNAIKEATFFYCAIKQNRMTR